MAAWVQPKRKYLFTYLEDIRTIKFSACLGRKEIFKSQWMAQVATHAPAIETWSWNWGVLLQSPANIKLPSVDVKILNLKSTTLHGAPDQPPNYLVSGMAQPFFCRFLQSAIIRSLPGISGRWFATWIWFSIQFGNIIPCHQGFSEGLQAPTSYIFIIMVPKTIVGWGSNRGTGGGIQRRFVNCFVGLTDHPEFDICFAYFIVCCALVSPQWIHHAFVLYNILLA